MTLQERIQTDPFVRNVGYAIVFTWAWLRICIVMGWAKPITPELAVQAISSTDSLMSFVAGYLYAGSTQTKPQLAGNSLINVPPSGGSQTLTATVTTPAPEPEKDGKA